MGNMGSCGSKSSSYNNAHGGDTNLYSSRAVAGSRSEMECGGPIHGGPILGLSQVNEAVTVTCGDDKRVALFDWNATRDIAYLTGHSRPVNKVGEERTMPGA